MTLTLNAAAQQAAYNGLAGKKGAVVAIEPKTGRILAMASRPSYDPNLLASHDPRRSARPGRTLNADKSKPLSNRAMQELYPPGSTFKLVTAAAALSSGKYTPETKVNSPAELPLPQTTVPLVNEDGQNCGGSNNATLTDRAAATPATPRSAPSASTSARTRCASRPRSSASASEPLTELRRGRQPVPRRPERSRRPRSPRSGSSTSARPRCRWRWWRPGSRTRAT